jgi:hypothetical protein
MGEFSFRRRAPARRGVAHPRRVLVAEDETLPDRTGGSMVIARMIAHLGRSEDHADDRRGNTAPITCTRDNCPSSLGRQGPAPTWPQITYVPSAAPDPSPTPSVEGQGQCRSSVGSIRPLVAAFALCTSRPAFAYRPFDGTDAAVADRGQLEIELGPVGLLREGPNRFLVLPALIASVGLCGAPRPSVAGARSSSSACAVRSSTRIPRAPIIPCSTRRAGPRPRMPRSRSPGSRAQRARC